MHFHSRQIPVWDARMMHGFAGRSKTRGVQFYGKSPGSNESNGSLPIEGFTPCDITYRTRMLFFLNCPRIGPMIRGITLNRHAPLTHQTPHIGPEAGNLGIRPSGGSDPESSGFDRLGDGG